MISATRTFSLGAFALATVLPAWAGAATRTYQNDGFESNDMVGIQQGFVAGEIGASCFEPEASDFPIQLQKIQLIFGGASEGRTETVTFIVYSQGGAGAQPDGQIAEIEVDLQSSDSALNEVDLTTENITVTDTFCVGLRFGHDGVPSIARDNDGTIDAGNNWINAQGFGWLQSNMLGLTGDWIIRVVGNAQGGGGGEDTGPRPDTGPGEDTGPSPDTGHEVFVSMISPTFGDAEEDINVTVTGGGFAAGQIFRIGPAPLTNLTVVTEMSVTGTLPADSLGPGTYDVIAADNRGVTLATYAQGFQVREPSHLPPEIDSIRPSSTTIGVSMDVIIRGANFQPGATVLIDNDELREITVQDDRSIDAFVPADHVDTPGSYDVTVRNPDGMTAVLSEAFTFEQKVSTGGDDGCSTARGRSGSGWPLLIVGLALARRRR